MLLISYLMHAGPVHNRQVVLEQPDGSTFMAIFAGDEFMRIKTTADGCAIIQDEEGWWCYARYDSDGRKVSTGNRIGGEINGGLLVESRRIPYEKLYELAARQRRKTVRHVTRSGGDSLDVNCPKIRHGIVILVQFANLSFKYTRDDFENLLNSSTYAGDGYSGCAKEYFDAQFKGQAEFEFYVSEIVTLSRNLDYYGGNISDSDRTDFDRAPGEMVVEACRLADNDIDFSTYDDDGDGEVDNVFVFFAGGDEAQGAGDDCIWSHAWEVTAATGQALVLDGVRIERYACASELTRFRTAESGYDYRLSGIGTFCHEFSHTMGLADMYDTDYEGSGGAASGLWGSTSLMDAGNYNNNGHTPPFFNALEREMLGLSKPELIESDGVYRLEPIHKHGRAYRINTDHEDEYYLIECRSEESWDKYIGGSGLLVYHVDKSNRPAGFSGIMGKDITAHERWLYNEVNANPSHQCVDLIEAIPEAESVRNVFYPLEGIVALAAESMPFWSGEVGRFSLTDIHWDGDEIVFSVVGGDEDTTPPDPVSLGYEKFQDAAIVTFESSFPYSGEALVSWGPTGKVLHTLPVNPYSEGKYALVLDGLEPRKSYSLTITFSIDGITGKQGTLSFMTNSFSKGYPYIYLKNVKRNPDGTFPMGSRLPLRVYNAVGAKNVEWSLEDTIIRVDEDGYYDLNEGGTLKAIVSWEDGSTDVIIKEVKISE